MFEIIYDTLVGNLLPRFHRKSKMMAWLHALLYPSDLLYHDLMVYRDQKLYEARVSGQVESMEWMLNDKFYGDGTLRNIYIDDNNDFENEVYIFNTSELETETYIYNRDETADEETYLFNQAEGKSGSDFTVWVPASLTYDSDYMRGLIDFFKLAGTTYDIKTY